MNMLDRHNEHLFLEKPDLNDNSFIANVNKTATNIDIIKKFNEYIEDEDISSMVEAVIENISDNGNYWVVKLQEVANSLIASKSAFNFATLVTIPEDIASGAEIELPDLAQYVVGTHMLMVSYNGTTCYIGEQYEEIGEIGETSKKIRMLFDLRANDKIMFRVIALNSETVLDKLPVRAEGSTEYRTLEKRFGDIINVKDFGAKGDGVTDDTEAIQVALDASSIRGGAAVYMPAGVYMQSKTLVLPGKTKLYGDGIDITVIKKASGMSTDALHTENYDALAEIEDQLASDLMPHDFCIEGLTFDGNYLSGAWNDPESAYVNTEGGGMRIIGAEMHIDCKVYNQAGVGAFIQAKGTEDLAMRRKDSDIKLTIVVTKWESLIYDGPSDIWLSNILGLISGARTVAEQNITEPSPTFGSVNGGVCDGIVFVDGSEIDQMHISGAFMGCGLRCLGGRINGDLIISESCRHGCIDISETCYGMISRILVHGGNGGDDGTTPDVIIRSKERPMHISALDIRSRSNVDKGQDKLHIPGSFVTITSCFINGYACSGDGLVIDGGSYNTIANLVVNNLSGTNKSGQPSSAYVRKAASSTSFNSISGIVTTVPNVFRAVGDSNIEKVHLKFRTKESSDTAFSGDIKRFGYAQDWDISGYLDNKLVTSKFVARAKFNPTITDEQIITVPHNLFTKPNISEVLLTIQDSFTSISMVDFAYLYVNGVTESEITIKLKLNSAQGSNTDPYITVRAEI